ncbi:MAG: HAD family hydrolase [Anaerolineae bacterium]|nr:HAD-IB family hydrolase [Thermoflexales bacterium]MDW8408773.1 HAD family hydrolase [Anaerolineae bacterium]
MALVFFDMDKTLLSTSSSTNYVKYLWRQRRITLIEAFNVALISVEYSLGVLDFPRAMARMSHSLRQGDAAAVRALCERWFAEELSRYIAPRALARVREHQQRGDVVYLLSASTQFAVEPVARHIGIPYRSTELEVVNNRFTGGIVGPPCYAEGKRYWGEHIAGQHHTPLSECVFYSDSYSDRTLLEAVGRPVAVNPDRRLRRLAQQRGWPIEQFY